MSDANVTNDNLGASRDEFYNLLMLAHEGLSEARSHALNARLVLLLANEIGDLDRLKAVIALGRSYEGPEGSP